ncbi:MAG: hypothetical protein HY675_10360 [Chloroflexi bacterium]|nr:hypothetical protein [Chloroflexota bacterium]
MPEDARTLSDAVLDVFRAYGVEYIFSSPGTEWSPVWDALARASAEGKGPCYFDTRHEDLAVAIAKGYYKQSEKLSVVLLHTAVGTLHAAMALRSARRERAPMVVLAGDSATFGEMAACEPGPQWARQLCDAGGSAAVAQPCVKRSTTVLSREVLLGTLQDACRLALTPPCGPVFLSVPLEFLFGDAIPFGGRCAPPPPPTYADSATLEQVAGALISARRPVLLTEYAGDKPGAVEQLVELAESLGMPVVEASDPVALNFPRDHALHLGFEAKRMVDEADLVLLVGCQQPWYPASKRTTDARVVLIDEDPGRELLNYWGFGVDQVVAGNLVGSLQQINRRVKERLAASSGVDQAREARKVSLRARHEQQHEELRAQALAAAQRRPMEGRWAAFNIGEVLPPDAIVVNETITHKGILLRHLRRNLPGTFHSPSSGGLGVGLGTALGVKVAAPDRLVVAIEGDGSFNYNPGLAAFGFAQQYRVPILVVIMNNQGYAAMKRSHLGNFPDGWCARTKTFYGVDIAPAPDYAAIAMAFGSFGDRVEDPEELPRVLGRAIERVQSGQLALLDLIVDPVR